MREIQIKFGRQLRDHQHRHQGWPELRSDEEGNA
jgi:hypothetical protein